LALERDSGVTAALPLGDSAEKLRSDESVASSYVAKGDGLLNQRQKTVVVVPIHLQLLFSRSLTCPHFNIPDADLVECLSAICRLADILVLRDEDDVPATTVASVVSGIWK
jgi:hypothetical protein